MLPNYFKKIGLAILLICAMHWLASVVNEKPFLGIISVKFACTLGLLLVYVAKEKDENPAISLLRLDAFFSSFSFFFLLYSAAAVVTLFFISTDAKTQENLVVRFQETNFLKFSGVLLAGSLLNFYKQLKKYRSVV
jgi:hypothetical protein